MRSAEFNEKMLKDTRKEMSLLGADEIAQDELDLLRLLCYQQQWHSRYPKNVINNEVCEMKYNKCLEILEKWNKLGWYTYQDDICLGKFINDGLRLGCTLIIELQMEEHLKRETA